MKTKFKMRCKKADAEGDWWEEEERNLFDETAQEYAERIISSFNESLRSNESKRELLEVVVLEENILEKEHCDECHTGSCLTCGGVGVCDACGEGACPDCNDGECPNCNGTGFIED